MYGKALFFVVIVLLGAVMPYILADEQWLADIEKRVATLQTKATQGKDESGASKADSDPLRESETKSTGATKAGGTVASKNDFMAYQPRAQELPSVVGPPGVPVEQLMSFDVTPDWVRQNWSRVSTRLGTLELQGYRVPIARRVGNNAFAGSLTYYFDAQRRVQRILLHGYCREPSPIVQLAQTRYQMRRLPHRLGDLYRADLQGQAVGALLVRYTSVVEHNSNKRCEFMMEINRIGTEYGMSRNFRRVLQSSADEIELFRPLTNPVAGT